jgi:hypothetical protein
MGARDDLVAYLPKERCINSRQPMLQARAALLQAREFGVIAMAVEQVFEATDKMDLKPIEGSNALDEI